MKYLKFSSWSEDEWEDMNSSEELCVVGKIGVEVDVYAETIKKVKKPRVPPIQAKKTKEELAAIKEEQEKWARISEQKALANRVDSDNEWFWIHLGNMLRSINMTLDKIDNDQYYASNTDGQVCRVVRDSEDTNHPATAAKETAQKILMYFVQQKFSGIRDEKRS